MTAPNIFFLRLQDHLVLKEIPNIRYLSNNKLSHGLARTVSGEENKVYAFD